MTKQSPHHPHTFIANIFGAIGHVATVFVWLLVLDLIVILMSLTGAISGVSNSLALLSTAGYTIETSTASQSVAAAHVPLQFLLIILLAVLAWVFCYLTARAMSGVLRHLIVLFGRKTSLATFGLVKYLAISMGLVGLVVLLQFVQPVFADVKLPIAFLGLAAGIVGIGAIWAQRILAERYRTAIDRVL